jgi:hypothetical protein
VKPANHPCVFDSIGSKLRIGSRLKPPTPAPKEAR